MPDLWYDIIKKKGNIVRWGHQQPSVGDEFIEEESAINRRRISDKI